MEQRQRLRRLADLGVEGHQPAIAAYVKMSEQEKERVALSIISQKVGANPKNLRSYEEHLKRSKEETQDDVEYKTTIKKAKVTLRNIVKWKRKRKEDDEEGDDDDKEGEPSDVRRTYTSRKLRCSRCLTEIETKTMQLHTKEGFRGIHCTGCKRQDRCLYNLCQCDVIWHQCPVHCIDPPLHASTRGVGKVKKTRKTVEKAKLEKKSPKDKKKRRGSWNKEKTKNGNQRPPATDDKARQV